MTKDIAKLNINRLIEEDPDSINYEFADKINELIDTVNILSAKINIILTLDSIPSSVVFMCMSRRNRKLRRKNENKV